MLFHPHDQRSSTEARRSLNPVFAEVYRGIAVVDKIVAAARDDNNNPLQSITMTVKE